MRGWGGTGGEEHSMQKCTLTIVHEHSILTWKNLHFCESHTYMSMLHTMRYLYLFLLYGYKKKFCTNRCKNVLVLGSITILFSLPLLQLCFPFVIFLLLNYPSCAYYFLLPHLLHPHVHKSLGQNQPPPTSTLYIPIASPFS